MLPPRVIGQGQIWEDEEGHQEARILAVFDGTEDDNKYVRYLHYRVSYPEQGIEDVDTVRQFISYYPYLID